MTPEEIAREAAEALVDFRADGRPPGYTLCEVGVGPALVMTGMCREAAEARAERTRQHLADAVLAAVERALRQVPCGSPVSDERLEQIREENEESDTAWTDSGARHVIAQLLAHADHLARVLRDCAEDGLLSRRQEVIDAAFRAGAEAQRGEIVEAMRTRQRRLAGSVAADAARDAAGDAADAPLAEPPA